MTDTESLDKKNVVVLLKGGRLPSWHALTCEQQDEYSQEHVELMLSVARKHRLIRLEGFKLIAPQRRWERFWIIEFPTLAGAESWIEAEIAPHYGTYGYQEYFLARPHLADHFKSWVTLPETIDPHLPITESNEEPSLLPYNKNLFLEVDKTSVVVLLFGRWLPEGNMATPQERKDAEHIELMQSVARDQGLIRLEPFQLIGVQNEWHRAWVMEFPSLDAAESWIENEVLPPHGRFSNKEFHLARKWAPRYFKKWAKW